MKMTIKAVLNSVRGRNFNKSEDLFTPEEEDEIITDTNENRRRPRDKSPEYLGNRERRNNSK
jgi:hypothetical protein